jgi:hypothetical protein
MPSLQPIPFDQEENCQKQAKDSEGVARGRFSQVGEWRADRDKANARHGNLAGMAHGAADSAEEAQREHGAAKRDQKHKPV